MSHEPRTCTPPHLPRCGHPVEARRDAPPTLSSQSLLRGQKAVAIEHNGELYRLQNTRAGKLILTK